MAWVILVLSGVFEAIWATALGESDRFTDPAATMVFAIALFISMTGLACAAKTIAIGTAYAVWTGLGAALTVGYAMVTGEEAASTLKVLFLVGIVSAVVGLRLLPAIGK